MWPNIEMDVIMAKLEALRDVLRIAYGSEGKTRESLFATAVTMVNDLAALVAAKAPEEEEDDE